MSDLLRSLGFASPFASESGAAQDLGGLPAGEELASLADGLESWSMPILEKVAAFTPVLLASFTHWLASTEKQQEEPLAARHPTSNTAFNSFPPSYKPEASLREQIAALLPEPLRGATQFEAWKPVIPLPADPAKMSLRKKHEHVIQLLPYYVSPVYKKQLGQLVQPGSLMQMALVSAAQALGPGQAIAVARMGMTAHQFTELGSQYRDYLQAVERANTELELYDAARNLAQLLARTHLLAILSMAQTKVQAVVKPIEPPAYPFGTEANNMVSFSRKVSSDAGNNPTSGDGSVKSQTGPPNPAAGSTTPSNVLTLERTTVHAQVQQSASASANTSTTATVGTAPTAMATPATLLAGLNLKSPSPLESGVLPAALPIATALGLQPLKPLPVPTGPDANPKQKALPFSPLKMPAMDGPGLNTKVEPPSLEQWLRELKTAADEVRRAIWVRYEQERRQSLRPLTPEEQRAQTGERLSPLAQMILDVLEGPQKLVELPMGSIAFEMNQSQRAKAIKEGFNWLRAQGLDLTVEKEARPSAKKIARVLKDALDHDAPVNWTAVAAALDVIGLIEAVQKQILVLWLEDIDVAPLLPQVISDIRKLQTPQDLLMHSADLAQNQPAIYRQPAVQEAFQQASARLSTLEETDTGAWAQKWPSTVYLLKKLSWQLPALEFPFSIPEGWRPENRVYAVTEDAQAQALFNYLTKGPGKNKSVYMQDSQHEIRLTSNGDGELFVFNEVPGTVGIEYPAHLLVNLDDFREMLAQSVQPGMPKLNVVRFDNPIPAAWQPALQPIDPKEIHQALEQDPQVNALMQLLPTSRLLQEQLWQLWTGWRDLSNEDGPRATEEINEHDSVAYINSVAGLRKYFGKSPTWSVNPLQANDVDGSKSNLIFHKKGANPVGKFQIEADLKGVGQPLDLMLLLLDTHDLFSHLVKLTVANKPQQPDKRKVTIEVSDHQGLVAVLAFLKEEIPALHLAQQPVEAGVLAALKKFKPTLGEPPSLVSGLLHAQEVAPGLRFAHTPDISNIHLQALGVAPYAGIEARRILIDKKIQMALNFTRKFAGGFAMFTKLVAEGLSQYNIDPTNPHVNLFETKVDPRKLDTDPKIGLLKAPVYVVYDVPSLAQEILRRKPYYQPPKKGLLLLKSEPFEAVNGVVGSLEVHLEAIIMTTNRNDGSAQFTTTLRVGFAHVTGTVALEIPVDFEERRFITIERFLATGVFEDLGVEHFALTFLLNTAKHLSCNLW